MGLKVPGGKAKRQPQKIKLAEGWEIIAVGWEIWGLKVPGGKAKRQPQKIKLGGGVIPGPCQETGVKM